METLPADLLRAEPGQSPGYAESAEEEFFSVEELRRQEERWRRARDCLQHLTGRQRRVVHENVMKGRTLTEIGDELGISHTAVRKHRQKGLERVINAKTVANCAGSQYSPAVRAWCMCNPYDASWCRQIWHHRR